MRLLVSDIRAAHCLEESTELDPRVLHGESGDQVKFMGPIKVDVQAQMTHTNIVVTGTVATKGQFNCARCLVEFEAPLGGKFQDGFSFDDEAIDLTELIRESVWVDVPLRSLCKENCLGLCPHCGVNRNNTVCSCKEQKDGRVNALGKFFK